MDDHKIKNEGIIGVYLKGKTRIGDMNVFYDYAPKDINTVEYFINSKTTHIGESKKENKIFTEKEQPKVRKKGIYLFRIIIKEIEQKINYSIKVDYKFPFNMDKKNKIKWEDYIWYVINTEINSEKSKDSDNSKNFENNISESNIIQNDDYILGENDILKIGNYKYIISKIFIKGKSVKVRKKFCDFLPTLQSVNKCESCGELMVRLCECQEYIHVNELKKWMNDRFRKEYGKKFSDNYYFHIYRCNAILNEDSHNSNNPITCNTDYPLNFKYSIKDLNDDENDNSEIKEIDNDKSGENMEEKIFNFVDIPIPNDKDYLILESFPEKEANSNIIPKSIHVVEITDEEDITIGRSHNNKIVLEDKMVSKFHAIIKYDKKSGNLIIKNLSKHAGTLALVHPNDDFLKLSSKPIFFQANKSFFEAKVTSLEDCIKNQIIFGKLFH